MNRLSFANEPFRAGCDASLMLSELERDTQPIETCIDRYLQRTQSLESAVGTASGVFAAYQGVPILQSFGAPTISR